jgi:GTPase SAR1 family protein
MLSADDAPSGGSEDLVATLDAGRALLREAWPDGHPALTALTTLRERLHESRLQVAVLGQFKRGKSTTINALLGASLLPSAVVPATAIPTFITWAPTPHLRASYHDNRAPEDITPADTEEIRTHLHDWVTEEGNPVNRRHIARVDLAVPAEVLRDGVVLIDTPGIGSTFQHNTDAALGVLPECDAALFVVSADPPLTEVESAYLARVRGHVVRLVFLLNKVDYLDDAELAEATRFLEKALQRALPNGAAPRVFPLSARRALEARTRGDAAALEASGLARIEREVLQTLAREKVEALRASVRAKAPVILDQAESDLSLRVRALELPLEDLQARAQSLETTVEETRAERRVAQDLLEGDRRRAVEELEAQAERLREEGRAHLGGLVAQVIDEHGGAVDRAAVQATLDAAVPVFFEERLAGVAGAFRRSVETMLARHQARADALITTLRRTAAALFDIRLRTEEPTEPFRLGQEPYWVTQEWSNVLMPSADTLLTRALPGKLRQARLRQEMEAQVAAVVQRNVENLRWATLRGLNDTFRRFSAQFDQRLAEVLALTQGAIGATIERRHSAAEHAADELQHLRALAERLGQVRATFGTVAEPCR